jgi:hypothetical protein
MTHHDGQRRRRLAEIIRGDHDLVSLLTTAQELGLPQWRAVAGCLYQTVWNVLTNKPARTGIRDYDLIYFDDRDLSWEAEDQVAQRVAQHMRNQNVDHLEGLSTMVHRRGRVERSKRPTVSGTPASR